MENRRRGIVQERIYGAARTALIGYGIAAFSFIDAGPWSGAAPQAPGLWGTPRGIVLLGIGLQVILLLARAVIKRHAPDWAESARAMLILELVADGVTVLLFALATLSAISRGAADL